MAFTRPLIALASLLCAALLPSLVCAEVAYFYQYNHDAQAACLARQAAVGEISPTKGCADYGPQTNIYGGQNFAGVFVTHSPNNYYSYYYREVYVPPPPDCGTKPDLQSSVQHLNGSIVCIGGCQYLAANLGDGGSVTLSPDLDGAGHGATCSVAPGGGWSCPSGYTALPASENPNGYLGQECIPSGQDADGDGEANGTDDSPTDPSNGDHDTDGDGIPDSRDSAPNDPDNGEDNGTGDESDNTSTGGGDCSYPPVSSGDAILAQIAFQTWATRCEAKRVADKPVAGNVTNNNTTINNNGTDFEPVTVDGAKAYPYGDDDAIAGLPTDTSGIVSSSPVDLGLLDATGFGMERTCPMVAAIEFPGFGMVAMPQQLICSTLQILAALIMLAGYVQAFYIVSGRG